MSQRGTGRQERAVQVYGEDAMPVRKRKRLERKDDLDAGVADQNVQASERLYHAPDTGIDLILQCDIHRDGDCLLSSPAR